LLLEERERLHEQSFGLLTSTVVRKEILSLLGERLRVRPGLRR